MAKYIYKNQEDFDITKNTGAFVPMETNKVGKELVYTGYDVIKKNIDKEYLDKDGSIKSETQDGYLGAWTYEFERDSRTYYIVQDNDIKELVIYHQPNQLLRYIMEINGHMYNSMPEEGDIIYSTYKEAKINLLEQQKNTVDNIQLRQQI